MTDPTPEWISKLSTYLYEAIYADTSHSDASSQHRQLTEAAQSFIASALHLVETARHSASLLEDDTAQIAIRPAPIADIAAQALLPMLHYAGTGGSSASLGPTRQPEQVTADPSVGHVLVDARLRVIEMNAAARTYIESPDNKFTLTHDRLSIAESKSSQALQKLVKLAASGQTSHPAGCNDLMVPGSSDFASGLIISVSPLPFDFAREGSMAVARLSIRRAFVPISPAVELRMHTLLGFTKKEAELASALLNGISLQHAAQERGVRLSTIRSQLASIFRKTGTTHQSQLVALLARLCIH